MTTTDMKTEEALSILSGVVNTFRSAKRLEEALEVAAGAEQLFKEKTVAKDKLNAKLTILSSEIRAIEHEIENEGPKRDEIIAETKEAIEKARLAVVDAQEKSHSDIKEIEEVAEKRLADLETSHSALMKRLSIEYSDKAEDLKELEDTIASVDAQRASLAEQLG